MSELEQQSVIADAKLEVAESLGWTCALVSSPGLYAFSDSWIITILGFGAVYFLATYKYRRAATVAEDAFYKEAKLGRYAPRN